MTPAHHKLAALSNSKLSKPTTSVLLNNSFQSAFEGLFKKEVVEPKKPKLPDVVIASDYNVAYLFAAIGLAILILSPSNSCSVGNTGLCPPSVAGAVLGGIPLLLASLFAVQAGRIRFLFDETSFELKVKSEGGDLDP